MSSAAYKFANQVLPLMLADMAQGRQPSEANYSRPVPSAPLPQGQTAVNAPAIQPAPALEPNVLSQPQPQQKAASFAAQLAAMAAHRLAEKEANLLALGRGALNFGRGALAVGKPLVGLARGGFAGAGRGVVNAGKTIAQAGPAGIAGAGTALYAGYSTLRNPIIEDGEGIRVRSPVRIPDVRWRSPITSNGGAWGSGIRFQKPWKTLW